MLGWLKSADALPAIARLATTDEDGEVRRVATGALGLSTEQGHATVLPALLAAQRDASWPVREEAATTLAKLVPPGAPAAAPALEVAAADPDPEVRKTARLALSRLASDTSAPTAE